MDKGSCRAVYHYLYRGFVKPISLRYMPIYTTCKSTGLAHVRFDILPCFCAKLKFLPPSANYLSVVLSLVMSPLNFSDLSESLKLQKLTVQLTGRAVGRLNRQLSNPLNSIRLILIHQFQSA